LTMTAEAMIAEEPCDKHRSILTKPMVGFPIKCFHQQKFDVGTDC
jgi:hypothetical protein